MRRRGPLRLGMIVLIVVGAVLFGIGARAGAASCATSGAGHVAEVIDFGDAPGAPAGVFSVCVPLTSGMRNGMQVLRAATNGDVGQDSSGKVCQIMGVPAQFDPTNCSAPVNGRISYWAYFRGTGTTWSYSGAGAAGVRVDPTIVEGWRFVVVDAGAQSAAPPPRNFVNGASSAWQSTCPPASDVSPPGTSPGLGGGVPSAGSAAPGEPSAAAPGSSVGAGVTPTSTTTPGPTMTATATTAPGEVAGLRSQRTAARLSRSQVRAEVAASKANARPVAAILSGIAVAAAVGASMVVATRRSRRRRRDRLD